ncbi:hypothetical protein KCP74_11770 [Salmonella enterica subsp. enterica]|nr:hypothetical protein KCP74_11770 [Salmonella enterica subsp. enterica]
MDTLPPLDQYQRLLNFAIYCRTSHDLHFFTACFGVERKSAVQYLIRTCTARALANRYLKRTELTSISFCGHIAINMAVRRTTGLGGGAVLSVISAKFFLWISSPSM